MSESVVVVAYVYAIPAIMVGVWATLDHLCLKMSSRRIVYAVFWPLALLVWILLQISPFGESAKLRRRIATAHGATELIRLRIEAEKAEAEYRKELDRFLTSDAP